MSDINPERRADINHGADICAAYHSKSLQLQREYIAARSAYQAAFDRLWLNLIILDGVR